MPLVKPAASRDYYPHLGVFVRPKNIAAAGTVLRWLGWCAIALGLLAAGVTIVKVVAPAGPAVGPSAAPLPETPIVAARRTIPGILAHIYKALDEGNPSSLKSVLSPGAQNNFQLFDAVCKPYTYRAHYIENIIERPNNQYEVWVRVLFKPLDEQAYALTFRNQGTGFVLDAVSETPPNWFGEEKERATELARQFVYAAKAGRADILSHLVTVDMPTAAFTIDTCWKEFFEDAVGEPKVVSAKLQSYKGLKVEVEMNMDLANILGFHGSGVGSAFFFVERVGEDYKIVVADPRGTTSFFHISQGVCYDPSRWRKVEDPNLEGRTLERFHLRSAAGERK